MRILSLFFAHDANCTLLEDGQPVAVLEKERLTRKKHDRGPLDLEPILEAFGWRPDSIDLVVFNPYIVRKDRGRFQWQVEGADYRERADYHEDGWSGPVEGRCSRHTLHLLGRRYDAVAVDHHVAHVAGALFTSPFEEAGVLSADGGGDDRMCALALGRGNRIEDIEYGWGYEGKNVQLNIGSVWASIGQHHFGMRRLEGAGKLMGLASYGAARAPWLPLLKEQMLRRPYRPLPLERFGWRRGPVLDPGDVFAQDLCATLQRLTTDLYLEGAARLAGRYGAKKAVMTGGCSMNCIANTAVHQSGLFSDTWVPAQPHDGGLSLGQALFAWHHLLDRPRTPEAWTPYLGTDAGSIDASVLPEILDYLEEGKTVGLCFGRAESGPRALGHRSILMDPRLPGGKDHLNERVKHREWYRPFAPMVLGDCGVPSKYMSYILSLDAGEVPAVTHVDGTSRPQVVTEADDPFIFALLTAWKERTGCPMLLNTSFNSREPLVDTVEHARATWRRTDLDVLVTPAGIETDKPGTP